MKPVHRARMPRTAATHSPAAASGAPVARKDTWWGRWRYRLDNTLSRGPFMVVAWIAAVTVAVILVTAVVLTAIGARIGDHRVGAVEGVWQAMLRVIDPGAMGADNGWPLRVSALLVTIAGIFLASALIGLIAAGIDRRIEDLRRGRSAVVEHGHTLVLGWSPRVFTVLEELCVANANQHKACIVVLADRDKPEMEEELRTRIGERHGTRIVCRRGDPANLGDLAIGRADAARSIVVLGDALESAGDAEVVKTVLAVLAVTATADPAGAIPVVAEVSDAEIAQALRHAGGGRVRCVRSSDVIARVTAQACRQAGLSMVCHELLDFDGDEIYFAAVPELAGHTFAEALTAFDEASVIGVRSGAGVVAVNPPMDRVFAEGDQVIAICEDDDRVLFTGWREHAPALAPAPGEPEAEIEHILVTGWNPLGPVILTELDQFALPGTTVEILVDEDLVGDLAVAATIDKLGLERLAVDVTLAKVDLEALTARLGRSHYDHIIVLGYRHTLTAAEADARTLLTMLLLQQMGAGVGMGRVVAEILDSRDVELAQVTGADDFVVSDALSGLMLAQLAENAELDAVFDDLFDSDGSALVVRRCERYVAPAALPWRDVVDTAAARGDVAIGYLCAANGDGVPVVNPAKREVVRFAPGDHVVVIGAP